MNKRKSKYRKVILNKQALNFIKLSKLRKADSKPPQSFIDLDELRDNPNTINEMLKQLSPIIAKEFERHQICYQKSIIFIG